MTDLSMVKFPKVDKKKDKVDVQETKSRDVKAYKTFTCLIYWTVDSMNLKLV